MAIKRRAKIGVVGFIHPADDAIDPALSDLEKYRDTWDDQHIVLKEDIKPTVFKVNFSLNWKKQTAVKNASFGMSEEGGAKFMLGNHSAQLVRSILVGIDQPESIAMGERIPFKQTKNGLVDEETMSELDELGIVDDIYSFYLKHKGDSEQLKKKIMAIFTVRNANHRELERQGRPYRCHICTKKNLKIAKLRRCLEDRWDFDEKDGALFPLQVQRGGPTFGFCPAKVERDDPETVSIFSMLSAILETNSWPKSGGIEQQEYFWVELVSEFGPFRRSLEFNQRYEMVAKGVGEAFGNKGAPRIQPTRSPRRR